jgi:hypothetical protein
MIMANNQRWVPMLASVGIGAAAYYSMTKGQGMGKMMQQVMPFGATNNTSNQSGQAYQSNQLQ